MGENRSARTRRGSGHAPTIECLENRRLFAITLVSINAAGTAPGNGQSAFLSFSGDGRFVLFRSTATDLVTGVTDAPNTSDLFVRDRVAGTTRLVTVNSAGSATGNGGSLAGQITGDGRYVVFTSVASDLVTGTTDNNNTNPNSTPANDVFVRDLQTNTTTLVSVNSAGTGTGDNDAAGGGASTIGGISADGRFVVFTSEATDLVAGFTDGNGSTSPDVFLRDVVAGTTTLISANAGGTASGNARSENARISTDGRFVVFQSGSSNLLNGVLDGNAIGGGDLFIRDLMTSTTKLISINAFNNASGNDSSFNFNVSPNGRFVAFQSLASNLVTVTDNGAADVFLRDTQADTTTLIDANPDGSANGQVGAGIPVVSGDGKIVAFDSRSNLIPTLTDNNAGPNPSDEGIDVFVRNVETGVTTLASINTDATATGNGSSSVKDISADGKFVLFSSTATDLVSGLINSTEADMYLRDLTNNTTRLVSINSMATGAANGVTTRAAFSPDSQFIALETTSSEFVSGLPDTNASSDVYVVDVASAGAGEGATLMPTVTAKLPPSAVAGAKVRVPVTVTLANTSDFDFSGPATVTLFVSNNETFDDGIDQQLTAVTRKLKIKAGATKTVKMRVSSFPESLAMDTYRILARSTAERVAGGTDATDNTLTIGPPFLDLTAPFPTPPPTSLTRGKKLLLPITVTNLGNTATSASPAITVNVVASIGDDILDAADVQIGTITKGLKLGAGKSKKLKLSLLAPETLPNGIYTLIMTVDAANGVTESNEANNTALAPGVGVGVT